MKKIFALISVAMLALGFTACSNDIDETVVEKAKQPIKLNITVSNMNEEAGSRAIKTGWENGDKLNIWFDQTSYANPDLVIKYNGSAWVTDTEATVSGNTPNASGNMIVLYEGNNDWSAYRHNNAYFYPTTSALSPAAYAQPIAYTNNNAISYTYESNILTANLNSWKSLTQVQVVVSGLDPAQASNYALKETDLKNGVAYLSSTNIGITNTTQGGYTVGVPNADGVAFCFTQNVKEANHFGANFTLKEISSGTEKTYSPTTGQIITSSSKVAGIKIAASKFE